MYLVDCFLIGLQIEFIRDIFKDNNLIVTFSFVYLCFIMSPPLSFTFFDKLNLQRVKGCFFTCDPHKQSVIEFDIGVF